MSEYIFVTNIFEYSNIRIYSSHSAQHTSKVDDPEPLPPKLAFLDHFFGENILFRQFDPMNTPKCYTWLESYGSTLKDGKNEKNIFSSCEASDFPGRSRTDFLHDLRLRHIRFDPNPQSLLKALHWFGKCSSSCLQYQLCSFGVPGLGLVLWTWS